jgi:metal-sulfur cluster biosynthetic enzyme
MATTNLNPTIKSTFTTTNNININIPNYSLAEFKDFPNFNQDQLIVDDDPSSSTSPSPNSLEELCVDELFNLIRDVNDPEHPLTLEQLSVVRKELIDIDVECSVISIGFTPTIPHCSMATLIGLSLTVKLLRSLSSQWKVNICIEAGTHASELAINKQLADKERVAAALENNHLLSVVNKCIANTDIR